MMSPSKSHSNELLAWFQSRRRPGAGVPTYGQPLLWRGYDHPVCSFCSMQDGSVDPRTHSLMMHAQLASNTTVTHALCYKHQSLSFSCRIGLPGTWLRGEVKLTRTAAKSLAPRS